MLRSFSLLLGLLTVTIVWKAGRLVFPGQAQLALLVSSFTAFNPQFIFSHAGISNISMTSLTANLTAFLIARMAVTKEVSIKQIFIVSIASGLSLLSRTTTIYLLPLAILVMFYTTVIKAQDYKRFLRSSALFLAGILLICGWWYARNWIQYSDPFLWKIHQTTIGYGWVRSEPADALYMLQSLAHLHCSYWAYFGRSEFHAGVMEYAVFLLLEVLALIGICAIVAKKGTFWKDNFNAKAFFVFLLCSVAALTEIMLLQLKISSPQGRYLYMTIASNSVLLAAGLLQISPENYRTKVSFFLPIFLLVSCLYLLIVYWHPHY